MTATDRFKALLANALERVCVLEAENEQLRAALSDALSANAQPAESGRMERVD